ncbi:MAG: hypothetical protein ACYC3G_01605 [Minisyncoccota bacterium]
MNKKSIFGLSLLLSFVLMGNSTIFADNGEKVSEQHRNNVSKIVQELEKIATKDRGLENEVNSVAREEKDVLDEVSQKMGAVENRGGFKTFFIGSDYKNLGSLRSELVKTDNRINRLTRSLERTASSTLRTDLENQIKELQKIKTSAENFIKDREGKFSLFGWIVKMFSK